MTKTKQATARGAGLLASMAIWASCAAGCMKTYRAPALPANQLALVTLDSSARALEVDGLPLPSAVGGRSAGEFFVGAGCRILMVKYEQSYFIWGDKKAARAGLGTGLAATLANTEQHDYETMKPIRFLIPARPGSRYWVTATFTGDEFLPRIVESDPSGNTVRRILPDEPCEGASVAPPAAPPANSAAVAPAPAPAP
jgi:hypothetical protein